MSPRDGKDALCGIDELPALEHTEVVETSRDLILRYQLKRPTSPRIVTSKQHSKAYVDVVCRAVNTFIINSLFSPYCPLIP
jgi:hypothetical protein